MKQVSHDEVVRIINTTLAGPVVDVLARLVPEVAGLPRDEAFERILDDLDLLERSFAAFRANIKMFRHLLVDARGKPVDDSRVPLHCGRSLDQVVSMVVRTAAKRHFRLHLDGTRAPRRAAAPRPVRRRADLFTRLRALLVGRDLTAARPKTKADLLYDAFGPLLAQDWQVPLLPQYAALTPRSVRQLGRRLLDYRVPDDVRRARMDPDAALPPTSIEVMEAMRIGVFRSGPALTSAPPAPVSRPATDAVRTGGGMAPAPIVETAAAPTVVNRAPIADMLTPDGSRLRAAAFDQVMLDPDVRWALPESALTLKVSEVLGRVGAPAARLLVDSLRLSSEQLAVVLMSAHAALGDKGFEMGFGVPGRPDYIGQLIQRAKAAGIGADSSLTALGAFVARLFNKGAGRR